MRGLDMFVKPIPPLKRAWLIIQVSLTTPLGWIAIVITLLFWLLGYNQLFAAGHMFGLGFHVSAILLGAIGLVIFFISAVFIYIGWQFMSLLLSIAQGIAAFLGFLFGGFMGY